MTIYNVLFPWFPFLADRYTSDNDFELIVITSGRSLPEGIDKLVVLHARHANMSESMLYKIDGTFVCKHCEKVVPFSKTLFIKLLAEISTGWLNSIVRDDKTSVRMARLVKMVPFMTMDRLVAIEQK